MPNERHHVSNANGPIAMTHDSPLPLTEMIQPADEAAVAAAVRAAAAAATPIYPIGGGTRLDYGAAPRKAGIGLSLARLARLIDYPADDMTVTVEAGMTLAELSRTLATAGQRLPIDMPLTPRASVGGAVAVDAAGPRRYGYGTMRDYVLGLRAVDGRGTAFSAGGRVLKNAAGYNLCRLLTGSLGTLAVVTQVSLLVRPLPETSALAACDLRDLAAAEPLLAALAGAGTLPVAVELRLRPAHRGGAVPPPLPEGSPIRLVVGFEGARADVEWMVGRLAEQWRRSGVSSLTTVTGDDAASWWQWLTDFPADMLVSSLPGAVVAVMTRLVELLPDCCLQAHAGNGVVRVQWPPPEGAAPATAGDGLAALLHDTVRPALAKLGGKLVVLSTAGRGELGRDDVWGPPGDAAAVMRALKERFDPAGVLNPGRFIY
jgi:glycolate oxidase FAD binding subunit